ncbi:hypothetical protein A2291_00825 [candidate division WOR-1 bacterium RIFOXYB2_FULL_42_35]|uniref:Uncharacterized protein n=1 Tax=candidate division WOR-1 bacterium RIFOXYC2_FULL_41_25 TaxID=1802586 RepID=A0A1F4TLK8_UNCSA|nr:MAG: hypothetical protein A2247_05810 [candidate division WOR-1 bacterium RIFOXYA2_FULL_41_14]OGC23600.1 MAG: hypothetical protein A2291_00825 [candidate division WOR-1 bacterium RIFOXYB2_FULL_42_35]OGC33564.1 MAG: hypothetical protein A2462_02640 [candidate division WOR-1 bacterium RIFOXYC2_FULL_41_25]OGC41881.1 MAG: hypothetical protein A2548_05570 [candidate division WOR-1 bacterium RIFOXYD2_FULL_41_8]
MVKLIRAGEPRYRGYKPEEQHPYLAKPLAPAEQKEVNQKQALFELWVQGIAARDALICEGRLQGWDGLYVEGFRSKPFKGNTTTNEHPPASGEYFDTWYLYDEGVHANVIQHALGEAVYLWRENGFGCEFMMLDYGPGGQRFGSRVDDLTEIFDWDKSYRGFGVAVDGKNHGGGCGIGTTGFARNSYLTRIASIGEGRVSVVDKRPGFYGRNNGPFDTVQTDLTTLDNAFSGFLAQGFVPVVGNVYRGAFFPPGQAGIIGVDRTEQGREVKRGSWQQAPAKELRTLQPGENVVIKYYAIGEKKQNFTITATVAALPNNANGYCLVFSGGHKRINIFDLIRVERTSYGVMIGERMRQDTSAYLYALEQRLQIKMGTKITVTYEKAAPVDEEKTHQGIVKEPPKPENQGCLVFMDGLTVGANYIKEATFV